MDEFLETAIADRERVRNALLAIGRQRWHEIAPISGVPFSTLKKFAYRQVEDPAFTAVRSIDLALEDLTT